MRHPPCLRDGSFTSPSDDFGTLLENDDNTFTYTAPDQTKDEFNTLGLLTSVVDPDGLQTTYAYTEQGQLSQVTASDGGVTNFAYNPDTLLLETITEPGGRVLTVEHDADGNLTLIEDPYDDDRSFSYDADGHMTEQQWGPLNEDGSGEIDEQYTYDFGVLTEIDDGDGSVYTITAVAAQGLISELTADAGDPLALVERSSGPPHHRHPRPRWPAAEGSQPRRDHPDLDR